MAPKPEVGAIGRLHSCNTRHWRQQNSRLKHQTGARILLWRCQKASGSEKAPTHSALHGSWGSQHTHPSPGSAQSLWDLLHPCSRLAPPLLVRESAPAGYSGSTPILDPWRHHFRASGLPKIHPLWTPRSIPSGPLDPSPLDPWIHPLWTPGSIPSGPLDPSPLDPWIHPLWTPGSLSGLTDCATRLSSSSP